MTSTFSPCRIKLVGSILLSCFALALWSPSVRASEESEQARIAAYRVLQSGDEAQKAQRWPEAARYYRDALNRYHELAATADEWEQDYYRFRIDHANRELARVVKTSGQDETALLATDQNELQIEAQRLKALYQATLEENLYLKRHIEELEAELHLYHEMEMIEQERDLLEKEPTSFNQQPKTEESAAAPPAPRHAVPVYDSNLFPPSKE